MSRNSSDDVPEGILPTLTIICLTYKHADFISKALDSFLMQVTEFEYEILICDDFSPDKTQEIVKKYSTDHPRGNLIRYFRHNMNIGVSENGRFALDNSRGRYIALCEGDDYWTDPYKLQKQVTFLDNHKDFVLTFHNTMDLYPSGAIPMYPDPIKSEFELSDFVHHTFARTVSVVFRAPGKLPNEYFNIKLGDSALFIYLLQAGKAWYINEIMASYRIHGNGLWNGNDLRARGRFRFEMFEQTLEIIKPEFKHLINQQLNELSIAYVISSIQMRDISGIKRGLRFFINSSFSFKIDKLTRALFNKISVKVKNN